MRRTLIIFLLFLLYFQNIAQENTVGLLSYQVDRSFDGYNLLYQHNQPNVYLLNNCGEIVHVWEDEDNFRPGNTAYLLDDGRLVKCKRDANFMDDAIWAGGGGAIIEMRDWDNNLIWSFEMNDSINRLHHDIAITQDETILALAWEYKDTEDCIAAGRDTSTLAQKTMWPDWIFEIDPEKDSIIWEWHAWDHLVQDFDPSKANYGVISEEVNKIDVNFGRVDGHPDWMHANALDYNAELDQILLSVPYFNEIWVIDHSTTNQESSGSAGGFGNKGGDLLWRWGNPLTYQQGDSTDQRLFFQHDAHWIDNNLPLSFPYYNQIAVYNNRIGADFSVANVVEPAWDMYDWVYLEEDGAFLPESTSVTISHPDPTKLWSTGLSSVQFLPNGNRLLSVGRFGYNVELTDDGDIVWEYVTPQKGVLPATQGDTLSINNNLTFRMRRYPVDHVAFADKDLSPKGWIELEPDTTFCDKLVSTMNPMSESNFRLYPNPVNDILQIEWDGIQHAHFVIHNIHGELISSFDANGGKVYYDVGQCHPGMYFVSFWYEGHWYARKFIKAN